MDSVTSEEKKVLEESETDFDYLIMDIGDSDIDDLDLQAGPSSPVLKSSTQPRQQNPIMNNESGPPATQPCKFSSNVKLSAKISPIRTLDANGMATNSLSQPNGRSGNEQTDSSESSVFPDGRRAIPLRAQAKCGAATIQPKPPSNIIRLPVTATRLEPNRPVKKRVRGLGSLSSADKEVGSSVPKRPRHEMLPITGSSDPQSDPESDVISLYARDEDYMSLYTNNPKREVILENQGTQKQSNSQKENQRNVILTAEPPQFHGNCEHSSDLRNRIIKKMPNDQQSIDMAKITQLLDKSTRSHALIAASSFCKAYMDRKIQKVNKEFYIMTRRLAEELFKFQEMKHLYRIARLAIDMQIVLSDRVLCGLIEHLGRNLETQKIAVILNQLRDKSILVGNCVFSLGSNYLRPKKAAANAFKNPLISDSPRKTGPRRNVFAPVQRTIVQQQLMPARIMARPEPTGNSSPSESTYQKQVAPQKQRSILKTPEMNSSAFGWNVDAPLYIQIPNQTTEKPKTTSFGCKAHDKKTQMFGMNANLLDTQPSSSSEKPKTLDGVDLAMLGKCLGQLAQAVGEHPIRDTLFSAIADLFSASRERPVEVCNDDSPKFMVFLESALEGLNNSGNVDKTKSWLAWIAAGVIQRFSLESTYRLAKMMKNIGVSLIPPPNGKNITQAEKKTQYLIANKIVSGCLDQNDIDLAIQVIEEYCTGKNQDPGPVLAPMLCEMLCSAASHAIGIEKYVDAAKCLALLPLGFGIGKECALMEQTLLGILNTDERHTANDEKICNQMVEQMLTRSMSTEIRSIIIKAFCANVVPVFKYLEGKGVYRRPQIAQCPHLILIPFILSMEEMALIIQRHLTELSDFLMEMNQMLRMDMPMRVVLCKNVGSLQPLSPFKNNSTRNPYFDGLKRLNDAVTGILDPSLRIVSKETNPQRQECVMKLDANTVRMWMSSNTDYQDARQPLRR